MPTISFRSAFAKRTWIIRHQALDTPDKRANEKTAVLVRLDYLRSLVESSDVTGLVDRLLDYGNLARVLARESAVVQHPLFWPWSELYRLAGDGLVLLKPESIEHLRARLAQEGLSPLERVLAEQALKLMERVDDTTQFPQSPEQELELIYSALNDPNPYMRRRAVEALHGSSTARARSEFERLRSDPDPWVQAAAEDALGAAQGLAKS
jgi:HEAT repeat protein